LLDRRNIGCPLLFYACTEIIQLFTIVPQLSLWAIEKALDHRAYGADYIQNILYQQMRPQRRHPPVSLKKPELNDIRLPPPCLAEYDSLVLKGKTHHDD